MLVLEDGAVMPSWFDIHEKKGGLLKPVKNVHKMIDNETEAGTNPSNVLVCGFSQGGRSLSLCTHIYSYTVRKTCALNSLLLVTRKYNLFIRFLGIGKCSAIHTLKLWEEVQCLVDGFLSIHL